MRFNAHVGFLRYASNEIRRSLSQPLISTPTLFLLISTIPLRLGFTILLGIAARDSLKYLQDCAGRRSGWVAISLVYTRAVKREETASIGRQPAYVKQVQEGGKPGPQMVVSDQPDLDVRSPCRPHLSPTRRGHWSLVTAGPHDTAPPLRRTSSGLNGFEPVAIRSEERKRILINTTCGRAFARWLGGTEYTTSSSTLLSDLGHTGRHFPREARCQA
jgi:hypothetical protein